MTSFVGIGFYGEQHQKVRYRNLRLEDAHLSPFGKQIISKQRSAVYFVTDGGDSNRILFPRKNTDLQDDFILLISELLNQSIQVNVMVHRFSGFIMDEEVVAKGKEICSLEEFLLAFPQVTPDIRYSILRREQPSKDWPYRE